NFASAGQRLRQLYMDTMQIKTSAVEFPTRMRPHVGLATRDVDRAVAFYSRLVMHEPTKRRPGYGKSQVHAPPINLTLNRAEAGFGVRDEENVTCCYAVQDKVWFVDPDGHQWEVFVVTEADAAVHSSTPAATTEPKAEPACCAPSCCK